VRVWGGHSVLQALNDNSSSHDAQSSTSRSGDRPATYTHRKQRVLQLNVPVDDAFSMAIVNSNHELLEKPAHGVSAHHSVLVCESVAALQCSMNRDMSRDSQQQRCALSDRTNEPPPRAGSRPPVRS
jgi:hypothetical protein